MATTGNNNNAAHFTELESNATDSREVGSCGSTLELCLAVLGSFLMWVDLYSVLQTFNWKRSAEWNCRIISATHGAVSATLCLTSGVILGPWPFNYIGYPPSILHCNIIIISIGYFLFDMAWCLYMKTEGLVMVCHHAITLFGLLYVVFYNLYGCEITTVLGSSEVTNPILQLRWFMKETGRLNAVRFLDFTFLSCFITIRLVAGTVYYAAVMLSPDVNFIGKGGGSAIYGVSVIFGIQLVLYVNRKYFVKTAKTD